MIICWNKLGKGHYEMKKFILGFIVGGVLFGATGAIAANEVIKAYVTDITFSVNDQKIELENPIVSINGRAYLPVRAVVENLGFGVDFKDAKINVNRIYKDRFPAQLKTYIDSVVESKIELHDTEQKNINANSSSTTSNSNKDTRDGLFHKYITSDTSSSNSQTDTKTNKQTNSTNNSISNTTANSTNINTQTSNTDYQKNQMEEEFKIFKAEMLNRISQIEREFPKARFYNDAQYNEKLEALYNDKLEVQTKMNVLLMDVSREAKIKRETYSSQITKIEDEISELNNNHRALLRIKALEDQIKAREEYLKK